jgi:putative ABC transport system permease protein
MSIWSWLKRRRMRLDEDDFQEEIRAHLAMAEKDQIESGADRERAHYAARKEFGNLTLTTEAARRVWTPRWLEALRDFTSDVRYAIRSLAKNRAFSLIVIGVLTLGIGLNALVFTVLKSMALTPLAGVQRSDQLRVILRETNAGRQLRLSYPDFKFLREHDRAFRGLMGSMFKLDQYRLGKGSSAPFVTVEFVTGNYFEVLGVNAALGRTLLPSDEIAPGRHPEIVISHSLWQREFGGAADMIGRTIEINRYPLTVVGVAAGGFHGTIPGYDVEVFIPIMMAADVGISGLGVGGASSGPSAPHILSDRGAQLLVPHGFLRPGVTPRAAAAQMDVLWKELARERSIAETDERLHILPFRQSPVGPQTYLLPTLTILSVMGSLVLLIACANISGLVLARGVSRRGELAARLALGATRTRIVRLLLVENLVLVVPGTVLGVLLALRGVRIFTGYVDVLAAPQRMFFNMGVDAITIGFAALIAILCAMVFGFVPALQTSRIDLVSVINQDASARGSARGRLQAGLVTAQVAVSLILLVGAGFVMRALDEAARQNPGFDDIHVTWVSLNLQQHGYDERSGRVFYRKLLDALRADAGIDSATLAGLTPLGIIEVPAEHLDIDGYAPSRGEDMAAQYNTVAPDYFRTLKINLVSGREFEDRDNESGAPVAIVNRTFAERFWGRAEAAVGKRFRLTGGDWRTIVGVAADLKYVRLNESPRPYFYLPFEQVYRPVMNVHTRGAADVTSLVKQTVSHIAALDRELDTTGQALHELRRVALFMFQIVAGMLFVFGAAGMMLAAMGTYGLVSYTVTQSTREIGIRMALGATPPSVVRVFVARSLRLGAKGAAIGLVLAFGATRFLGGALFNISLTDGRSFAGALAIVIGAVIVATLVPAWRGARTNPLVALRHL